MKQEHTTTNMEMGTIIVNRGETRIRVYRSTDRARAIRTRCPHDSPVSGVFSNYHSTPRLKIFVRENAQDHDAPAQNPDDTRCNNETPLAACLFVDDRSLYIALDSLTTNAEKLQKAWSHGQAGHLTLIMQNLVAALTVLMTVLTVLMTVLTGLGGSWPECVMTWQLLGLRLGTVMHGKWKYVYNLW